LAPWTANAAPLHFHIWIKVRIHFIHYKTQGKGKMKSKRSIILLFPLLVALAFTGFLAKGLEQANFGKNLVVVADTTAGMGPKLNALLQVWPGSTIPQYPENRQFDLIAYKDQARFIGSADNANDFKALFDELQVGGGGDCQDAVLQALASVARNRPDSRALLFGASAPMGNSSNLAFIVNKLIANGVRVFPANSGWCDDAELTPDALITLAMLTGGYPYNHPDDETGVALNRALNSITLADNILTQQGTVDGIEVIPLGIDTTVTTLGADEDKRIY
jgi:hypothetical protein